MQKLKISKDRFVSRVQARESMINILQLSIRLICPGQNKVRS